jgi:hypothetical protein
MDVNVHSVRMTVVCGIIHKNTKHTDKYNSKYYKNFTYNNGFTQSTQIFCYTYTAGNLCYIKTKDL